MALRKHDRDSVLELAAMQFREREVGKLATAGTPLPRSSVDFDVVNSCFAGSFASGRPSIAARPGFSISSAGSALSSFADGVTVSV